MDARSAIFGLSQAHKNAPASSVTEESAENSNVTDTGASSVKVVAQDVENANGAMAEEPESRAPLGESSAANVDPHAELMANRQSVKTGNASALPKHLLGALSGGVAISAETPPRPVKRPPPRPPPQAPAAVTDEIDNNDKESIDSTAAEVLVLAQAEEIASLREKCAALDKECDSAFEVAAQAKADAAKQITGMEASLNGEKTRYSDLESKFKSLQTECSDREAQLQKQLDQAAALNERQQATVEKVTRSRDILQVEYDSVKEYLKEVAVESGDMLGLASKVLSDVEVALGCST